MLQVNSFPLMLLGIIVFPDILDFYIFLKFTVGFPIENIVIDSRLIQVFHKKRLDTFSLVFGENADKIEVEDRRVF